MQQPLLNEKVLRDKRKKLRETFERIVRLYERENPDTYKELRKLELDYETKRGQLSLYFDSVKVCLYGRQTWFPFFVCICLCTSTFGICYPTFLGHLKAKSMHIPVILLGHKG